MKLYRLPLGPLQTNCYIIGEDESPRCWIFDPGSEGPYLVDLLKERKLKPEAILLTHGHGDHIGAVQALVDEFSIPVYIHEGDTEFLTNSQVNLSAAMGLQITVSADIQYVVDGQTLVLGDFEFTVLHTPGHTPGGVCYYGHGLVIAGDTLFQESVGRTDFLGSSFDDLIAGIQEKLFVLPNETVVYPGHGPETTIGHEKTYNPFVR
ncbi:MBL fold metallo-hydrolase [uncultured Veillonella sp.]|uniref:MBL fold metallo-hydrolase n=1 Tax=uncultured Veillonella sp. TaxID=159268 RepID=UPI002613C9C2|nr:MBL fold metallo-hydrolase [uncultured Veillonella sp.]